jgi:hypothetical protein
MKKGIFVSTLVPISTNPIRETRFSSRERGSLEHFVKMLISPKCSFLQSSFLKVPHFVGEEGEGATKVIPMLQTML